MRIEILDHRYKSRNVRDLKFNEWRKPDQGSQSGASPLTLHLEPRYMESFRKGNPHTRLYHLVGEIAKGTFHMAARFQCAQAARSIKNVAYRGSFRIERKKEGVGKFGKKWWKWKNLENSGLDVRGWPAAFYQLLETIGPGDL